MGNEAKPVEWSLVRATGGVIFLVRKTRQLTLHTTEVEAQDLLDLLNLYERKIFQLERRLDRG